MEITKIPEPITMTAAMSMLTTSKRTLEICALICEYVLKEQNDDEMQDYVNNLRDMFLVQIPPSLDSITRAEAEKLAMGMVGIGGIVTVHDELEDTIYDTIEAVVDGTKAAIQNFGNFVADNE